MKISVLTMAVALLGLSSPSKGSASTSLNCVPEEVVVSLWDYKNGGYTPTTKSFTLSLGSNQSTSKTAGQQQSATSTRDTERSSGSSSHSETNVGGSASVNVGVAGFGGSAGVSGSKTSGSSMQQGFVDRIGSSSTSGFNWETASSTIFTSESSTTDTYTCDAQSHCLLTQLVGRCGAFEVKTNKFTFTSTPLLKPGPEIDSTVLKPSQMPVKLPQRPNEIWILAANLTFANYSGIWEQIELCPPATFVNGFKYRSQNGSGLTGLSLDCSKRNGSTPFQTVKEIESGVGHGGSWYRPFQHGRASQAANGFFWQSWLKILRNGQNGPQKSLYRGNYKLNFQGKDTSYLFRPRGSRSIESHRVTCPEKYAVCGIMTMLDEETKSIVTNLALQCCYYCIPEERLDVIASYQNEGQQQTSHSGQTTVGSRKETGTSSGGTNGTENHKSSEGKNLAGIQAGFAAQFGGSSSNGFNWGSTSSSSWHEEKSESFSWFCPGRHSCKVKQLVGVCGDFQVLTNHRVIQQIPLDQPDHGVL